MVEHLDGESLQTTQHFRQKKSLAGVQEVAQEKKRVRIDRHRKESTEQATHVVLDALLGYRARLPHTRVEKPQ